MNEPRRERGGELPHYDADLGADKVKWTRGIRRNVLLGNFDAEPGGDAAMILAFKASGLGVNEFLDKKEKGEI
jgi:hypothetical protein